MTQLYKVSHMYPCQTDILEVFFSTLYSKFFNKIHSFFNKDLVGKVINFIYVSNQTKF